MHTIAHQIYPQHFHQVESIVQAIHCSDFQQANALLIEHTNNLSAISGESARLQVELFLEALRTRLNHAEATANSNLYLRPDEGQQIQMFNFMAQKFPVVSRAQAIANGLMAEAIGGSDRFVLLDIGLGTGQQAEALLRTVTGHVKQVTILGVEPAPESVEIARRRFEALSLETGIRISFTCIHKTAEQLEPADWLLFEAAASQTDLPLLINASFALHHVQPVSCRTEFFRKLKMLEPAVFVIIEPYNDHTTDNYLERFRNAWHHYGLTFQAIDTIEAPDEEKSAVKRVFFGRELPDVMGDQVQVEQYETAEMWVERLRNAGFNPFSIAPPTQQGFNSLITLSSREDYISFDVNKHPIVAVIGAV